jgi:hypothetical protein
VTDCPRQRIPEAAVEIHQSLDAYLVQELEELSS